MIPDLLQNTITLPKYFKFSSEKSDLRFNFIKVKERAYVQLFAWEKRIKKGISRREKKWKAVSRLKGYDGRK